MYLFYLGNNRELSRWELQSLLPSVDFMESSYGMICSDSAVQSVDFGALQRRAGGLREIIQYNDQVFTDWEKAIMSMRDEYIGDHKEVTLQAPSCDEKEREHMLQNLKRYWHERTGKSLRFRLNKTYLVDNGGSVLWWIPVPDQAGSFWLGCSLTQQSIRSYAKRDYDKPERSMQRGMLPPKLAQIMINGAQLDVSQVLWDPFCGTGTVLIEAALLGIASIGSDNESSAIRETQGNIASVLSFDEQKKIQCLWQQNITYQWDFPKEWLSADQNLVIVAEGYLGPIQTKALLPGEGLRTFWQKVEPLYQKFFSQLNKSVIKKMVLATPIVLMPENSSRLAKRTWDILLKHGWEMSFSSDYTRANQFIGRHIACLQRN